MHNETKGKAYEAPVVEDRGDAVRGTASIVSLRTPKEGATMLWAPDGE